MLSQDVAITRPTAIQSRIIDIAQQHPDLSCRQIGELAHADKAHVVRTLQRYGITKDLTDAYKAHRADVLAGLQDRLLSSITDEDIKRASLLQRITAMGVIYDKERIELGLVTQQHLATIVFQMPEPRLPPPRPEDDNVK